jgi:hypothetical protein
VVTNRLRWVGLSLSLAAVVLVSAACTGRVSPQIAAKGTTIILPLPQIPLTGPSEMPFGSLTGDAYSRVDNQRGNLVVGLCPGATDTCTPDPNHGYLVTRYVTSLVPDPASPAGLNNRLAALNLGTQTAVQGEVLALVEIPDDPALAAGQYSLSLRTRRGSTPGVNETVLGLVQPGPIQIIDRPAGMAAAPTPLQTTSGPSIVTNVANDLADLIPYPTVLVRISDAREQDPFFYPAAAEFTVSYPSTVSIKGVYEDKSTGRRSIVSMVNDTANHVLKISLVDPTRCTQGVRIAYDWAAGRSTPVSYTEFAVTDAKTYDASGSAYSTVPNTDVVVRLFSSFTNSRLCPS